MSKEVRWRDRPGYLFFYISVRLFFLKLWARLWEFLPLHWRVPIICYNQGSRFVDGICESSDCSAVNSGQDSSLESVFIAVYELLGSVLGWVEQDLLVIVKETGKVLTEIVSIVVCPPSEESYAIVECF